MKKIVTAFMMIVCMASFVACIGGTGKKTTSDAESVVKTYLEALESLNLEEAKACFEDESVLKNIKSVDKDAIMAKFPEELASAKAEYEKALDAAIKKTKDNISTQIENTKEENKEYIVTVKITMPKENIVEKYTGAKNAEKIKREFADSGKISEDSSKEDVLKAVFAEMLDEINHAEIKTQTITQKLVAYEKDGEWVINTDKTTE